MLDEVLERLGLKYEDLKPAEKETLNTWLESIQSSQVTVDKVREYISSMKAAVEQELCKPRISKNKDIFLKARLRNYMLLEGFLSTPERAKKQLEAALSRVGKQNAV